jgi:hypothetical protein
MDDQTFLPPLTIKERSRSGRHISEQTTELLAKTNVFSPPHLGRKARVKPYRTKEIKMKLSIWTMLVAGYLLSAPGTRAGQIPLKNAPLERQTDQNLNMKRYVAAGDRAYVVGVLDGTQVPAVSLNPNGIGWHITGQMGGV